ncbi:swarming motility protein ybiA, partial [Trifolium medium]|nr:swarming motility protein ybiA [Trifolium medium]
MEIPVFNEEDDAYWWVLCMDKYFDAMRTPEEKKMTVVAKAIKGNAILWWFCWVHHHPEANWETFSWEFLWHFKPEYRDVLSPPDEEGKLDLESEGGTSMNNTGVSYDDPTEEKPTKEVVVKKTKKVDPEGGGNGFEDQTLYSDGKCPIEISEKQIERSHYFPLSPKPLLAAPPVTIPPKPKPPDIHPDGAFPELWKTKPPWTSTVGELPKPVTLPTLRKPPDRNTSEDT